MSDAVEPAGPTRADGAGRPVARLLGLLVLAGLLVGLATWQVGPRPDDADDGLPTSPPPLALPSDVPDDAPLARAAAQLAAGDLDDARARFVDVVAEDQDGVAGQIGLVLSRWRSTGPVSVERDLVQLAREYPESALVSLHLGLVQLLLEQDRAARESLRAALELGRTAADPTSLRMARLAEDLLHPRTFRGTMPVLVQPTEVDADDRVELGRLLAAVAAGDQRRASRLAARLERSSDALVRVAAIAATFDKGEPDATVERLAAIAEAPTPPLPARDRARFMATLAELWGGGARDAGCSRLAASAAADIDAGTRRLAGPIHRELCPTG